MTFTSSIWSLTWTPGFSCKPSDSDLVFDRRKQIGEAGGWNISVQNWCSSESCGGRWASACPKHGQHTSFVQRVLEHTAYLAEEQGNHGLGQHCAAVTTEHWWFSSQSALVSVLITILCWEQTEAPPWQHQMQWEKNQFLMLRSSSRHSNTWAGE